MKRSIYILFALMIFGLVFCSTENTKEEKLKNIEVLESTSYIDTTTYEINEKHANELVSAYSDFAENFSDDENSPEYLFRSAEICRSIYESQKAIDFYDKIILKYENFEKAPYCLFLKAFTYDNQLQDMIRAKENYSLFIELYPEHDFADDAKILIDNLGKTPEELIKSFEDKSGISKDSI